MCWAINVHEIFADIPEEDSSTDLTPPRPLIVNVKRVPKPEGRMTLSRICSSTHTPQGAQTRKRQNVTTQMPSTTCSKVAATQKSCSPVVTAQTIRNPNMSAEWSPPKRRKRTAEELDLYRATRAYAQQRWREKKQK